MLGLKLETDPHWVNIVEKNIEEILTDHAWCEQKAATNAISIVIGYPYHSDLVDELLSLAKEELSDAWQSWQHSDQTETAQRCHSAPIERVARTGELIERHAGPLG